MKPDFEMFARIPLENLVPKLDPLGVDLLKVDISFILSSSFSLSHACL